MSKCIFDCENECAALIEKKCGGCKFRKTNKEFEQAQIEAAQILKRKHLVRIRNDKGHTAIMSTELCHKGWE